MKNPRWGPGLWDDEPDEFKWLASGIPCLIQRHPSMGHWCGYVGVPEGHPWYKTGYDDVTRSGIPCLIQRHPSMGHWCGRTRDSDGARDWVDVHGGLTYAGKCPSDDPDKLGWLGFDCAHSGDHIPGLSLGPRGDDVYRDKAYVQAECERLATQAVGASSKGGEA